MASQFLLLPVLNENSQEIDSLSLYSLKHKKPYNLKTHENLKHLRCLGGSCDGWLAFLDELGNPFLLNLFTRSRISLPPSKNISTIVKLVRSSHAVVIMHSQLGLKTSIALCREGDEMWTDLDSKGGEYYDVVCCDKTSRLYALAVAEGPRIESWDLTQTTPKKVIIVQDSCPRTLQLAHQTFPTDLYSSQWYLALSPLGQLLLIVRFIGEFVRYDGEVVYEGDTLTDYAAEPLICPYKTVSFRVFKLDGREWRDVESLNDSVLFLGGSQSLMVSREECDDMKGNSIYFTDDYWMRMDEDYTYGGHDMGVFSLEDGSIEDIVDCQHQKIQPPPIWISLSI